VLLGYGSTNPYPESRATQSSSPQVVEDSIRGSLDFTVLRALSQRQSAAEIATQTGVAPPIISAKIGQLFQEGYITENNYLTEKGFDALNRR
jgi:predicted transcriptional regulator